MENQSIRYQNYPMYQLDMIINKVIMKQVSVIFNDMKDCKKFWLNVKKTDNNRYLKLPLK